MQYRTDEEEVRCTTGRVQDTEDRSDAEQEGCWTGLMKDRSDRGQDGCRTDQMQDRTDAVQEG